MSKSANRWEERKRLELMLAKLDKKSQLVEEPSLSSPCGKHGKVVLSARSKVQNSAINGEDGSSSKMLPLDPKKMKRLANNRLSSHRCRIKRELKTLELEEKCSQLMLQVQKLPTVIDYYARQQIQLKKENEALIQNISNVKLKLYYGEVRADNLRKEIQNLRMLYGAKMGEVQMEQQLQNTTEVHPQNLQHDPLDDANNIDIFFA